MAATPETFVVLGSNSFSGATFVAEALADGARVIGISRSPEPDEALLPYAWAPHDLFTFHALDFNRDLDRIEAVVQGAAAPATSGGVNVVNVGEVLPPFKSTQYEVGGKLTFDTITANLSFFTTDRATAIVVPASAAGSAPRASATSDAFSTPPSASTGNGKGVMWETTRMRRSRSRWIDVR